jgi:hypothetical protein
MAYLNRNISIQRLFIYPASREGNSFPGNRNMPEHSHKTYRTSPETAIPCRNTKITSPSPILPHRIRQNLSHKRPVVEGAAIPELFQ